MTLQLSLLQNKTVRNLNNKVLADSQFYSVNKSSTIEIVKQRIFKRIILIFVAKIVNKYSFKMITTIDLSLLIDDNVTWK